MKVHSGQPLCHLYYYGQMKDSYLPGGIGAVLSYLDILWHNVFIGQLGLWGLLVDTTHLQGFLMRKSVHGLIQKISDYSYLLT